jgi:hypothetical protein
VDRVAELIAHEGRDGLGPGGAGTDVVPDDARGDFTAVTVGVCRDEAVGPVRLLLQGPDLDLLELVRVESFQCGSQLRSNFGRRAAEFHPHLLEDVRFRTRHRHPRPLDVQRQHDVAPHALVSDLYGHAVQV